MAITKKKKSKLAVSKNVTAAASMAKKKAEEEALKKKEEENNKEEDMSAIILKGLTQLNELSKTLEEQINEYIKKKGPLDISDEACPAPITNCGPSSLVTTFQPCPPLTTKNGDAKELKKNALRCPCCGTICTN